MGRYSGPLGQRFLDSIGLSDGDRALDVGCGPGVLTVQLVERLGATNVSAVDPSPAFVVAAQQRCPGVDVRRSTAEPLPFEDDVFDAVLAQLVVPFMTDAVSGLREMSRVTAPGGIVAASVWDHAGGGSPLALFWQAVTDVDPSAKTESAHAGARSGQLAELFRTAGLIDVRETLLSVSVSCHSFDEWWEPYTLGVGPAGDYVTGLDDDAKSVLRDRCFRLLPPAPFEVPASAWCVVAQAAA